MATPLIMNNHYVCSQEAKELAAQAAPHGMAAPRGRAPIRSRHRRTKSFRRAQVKLDNSMASASPPRASLNKASFDERHATQQEMRDAIFQWREDVQAALLQESASETAAPTSEPSSVPLPPSSDEEEEHMDSSTCRKRLRDQDSSDDEEGPRKQLANSSDPEQPEDGGIISDCSGPPSPGAASLSGAAPHTGEHSDDTVSPGDHPSSDDGCTVSTAVAVSAATPPISRPGSEGAAPAAPAATEADEAAMEVSGEASAEMTTPPHPAAAFRKDPSRPPITVNPRKKKKKKKRQPAPVSRGVTAASSFPGGSHTQTDIPVTARTVLPSVAVPPASPPVDQEAVISSSVIITDALKAVFS
ncbi:hypothetical protein HPB50_021396 [Hyalomma asiaticum]|uniref:Uncharacterized protein n=1 Tax=Hyalomma asiaticum TaxID=266040 RepID=A0ACB7RMM7_HYAAI|nr:hypothetical protein HPB50_021396 [Hyalomma asiaticum]